MARTPTSLPWYSSQEDYQTIVKMVPELESRNALPYKDFVSKLEALERQFSTGDSICIRIEIKPAAVKAWCENQKMPFCRDSIAKYATVKMAQNITASGN